MKLWVIRHAKSSWADPGQPDYDRPLNGRGKKNGKRLMPWMRAQPDRPAWIVASDARRARDTAEFVRDGYEVANGHLCFDHRLYHASSTTMLDVVRELPDICPSVALVGHNPGSTEFINSMLGETALTNLPTFGIAILDVELPWLDVHFGCARLCGIHTPKSLRNKPESP